MPRVLCAFRAESLTVHSLPCIVPLCLPPCGAYICNVSHSQCMLHGQGVEVSDTCQIGMTMAPHGTTHATASQSPPTKNNPHTTALAAGPDTVAHNRSSLRQCGPPSPARSPAYGRVKTRDLRAGAHCGAALDSGASPGSSAYMSLIYLLLKYLPCISLKTPAWPQCGRSGHGKGGPAQHTTHCKCQLTASANSLRVPVAVVEHPLQL
eukprot:jgi/Ulvmu1/12274/UM087_0008.1